MDGMDGHGRAEAWQVEAVRRGGTDEHYAAAAGHICAGPRTDSTAEEMHSIETRCGGKDGRGDDVRRHGQGMRFDAEANHSAAMTSKGKALVGAGRQWQRTDRLSGGIAETRLAMAGRG